MSWRTLIPALPPRRELGPVLGDVCVEVEFTTVNQHQAASDVIVLVVENTQAIVFSVHGTVRASSAHPPHRSTTISPSMLTATEAPKSHLTRAWLRTARAGGGSGHARAAEHRWVVAHDASLRKSQVKPTPVWRGGL